jgi:hypothetical protein
MNLSISKSKVMPELWNISKTVGMLKFYQGMLYLAMRNIPDSKKQVLTYLQLANKRLDLLINFGSKVLRDGVLRLVDGLCGEKEL